MYLENAPLDYIFCRLHAVEQDLDISPQRVMILVLEQLDVLFSNCQTLQHESSSGAAKERTTLLIQNFFQKACFRSLRSSTTSGKQK